MAFIDYGALLKVDGEFINKNRDIFMNKSDTGYVCEKAKDDQGDWHSVQGNYFVYAGDKEFLVVFYKTHCKIISNERIIYSEWYMPFASETLLFEGLPEITISHLDENLYIRKIKNDNKEEYDKGCIPQQWYERYCKRIHRTNKNGGLYRYRTARWVAQWQHNNHNYKVIWGLGVDPQETVWDQVKYSDYDFTDIERATIDKWFTEE